ncbi:MAG: SDR family oxidoreductase [Bacteroidetes bacterium]|nr:MAG: SDR family oxidoreductase [Bacteroidota bacterium]
MSFFQEKIIWITGASSGLGEAIAVECAREKPKLVLSARRESELQRVKKECTKFISEENILILPLDVAELSNVNEEVQKVIKKFGRIDILINNAGVVQRSYVIDTPVELERKMMEVNYFGAVILSKAVLPFMRKQNSGNILAVSSVMGKMGFSGRSTYSAAKHALHGYFETLRIEEKRNGINVHIICPGYIKTNVSLNAMTASGNNYGKMDKGQEKGMDPNIAARKVLKAIRRNKFETFFGGKELIAITVKRLFPSLFYWLILKAGKPKF